MKAQGKDLLAHKCVGVHYQPQKDNEEKSRSEDLDRMKYHMKSSQIFLAVKVAKLQSMNESVMRRYSSPDLGCLTINSQVLMSITTPTPPVHLQDVAVGAVAFLQILAPDELADLAFVAVLKPLAVVAAVVVDVKPLVDVVEEPASDEVVPAVLLLVALAKAVVVAVAAVKLLLALLLLDALSLAEVLLPV